MPRPNACRRLAITLLVVSACTQPVPGVLTLAPAGMRTTGTCTPHPNGTLTMAAPATAESEVYVDAGRVTVTVTAASADPDQPLSIELSFAGTNIGTSRVQTSQPTAFPFHAQMRASGPVAIRLAVRNDAPAPSPAMLDVEKVVITQP